MILKSDFRTLMDTDNIIIFVIHLLKKSSNIS
jgi:hypothetical protein